MIIDLTRLRSGLETKTDFHEKVTISSEKLSRTEILKLEDLVVEGTIMKSPIDNYEIYMHMSGTMVLPCALTLEPTDYPFEIEIEDDVLTLLNEMDENVKKIENSLDILPIIWENILMEIPMRVVNPKASSGKQEGDGWKVITEDEEKEVVNPAFAKIQDLFK